MSTAKFIEKRRMVVKKILLVACVLLICVFVVAIIGVYGFLNTPLFDFSYEIQQDNVSLTIYSMNPSTFTNFPLGVNDLIALDNSAVKKIVVEAHDFEKHIENFENIKVKDVLPKKGKSTYSDIRLYYVIEGERNGRLLDVAMWGGNGEENGTCVFVNGIEVREKNIFYELILPFLPDEEANVWANYLVQ